MPLIKRAKQVPYSCSEMYQLVNDVASYPAFVPWCSGSEVLHASADQIQASLTFAKGGLERSFTTVNTLTADKRIEIRLVDGPFEHLQGFWHFEARGGGCLVVLDLDFEFNHKLTQMMFGSLFNHVASLLVDTFCERAHDLYED